MKSGRFRLAAFALSLAMGASVFSTSALALGDDGEGDKAKPKPAAKRADIYDPKADARELVANAVAKADKDHKRVLLMFGGNWCGWCHKLHDVFKTNAKIAKLLRYEYELAMVDTAAPNADKVFEELKGDPKAGVPFLIVLDGKGQPVVRQETSSLEEGDHHDPAKVEAFLAKWKAEPVDAVAAFDSALKRASSEEKMVFLHFGAPWCGWCHRLEDFLAQKEVTEILGRDYIDLKIDMDRDTGAADVAKRFRKSEAGGIPWFAFVDGQGKELINSDGPDGKSNIGYPMEPKEISWFIEMLKKTTKKVDAAQIERIEVLLKEAGDKIRASRPARPAQPTP